MVGLRPCLTHREPCFPEAFGWFVIWGVVPGGGGQGPPGLSMELGTLCGTRDGTRLVLSKASTLLPMGCALSVVFWWPLAYRLIKYVDALNDSNKIEKQLTSGESFLSYMAPPGALHEVSMLRFGGSQFTHTSLCACWRNGSALGFFLRSFAPRSSLPQPKFCGWSAL